MKRLLVSALLLKERIAFATAFSFALHAFVLFGITFTLPDGRNFITKLSPLEVTLVNSKSKNKPNKARSYAQHNLDGGGNTEEDRRAGTPFPVLGDASRFSPEQASQRVKALEEEQKRLLTQSKSNYRLDLDKQRAQPVTSQLSGQDLVDSALEIARLEAEIAKNVSLYEKMPKRKFLGARTEEYRYARYEDDFRAKVERIGTMNYPEAARQKKLYGKLRLTVSIRSDGSVEKVEIEQSSGQRLLDASAIRIVRLAAPYAPFPPDIRKEVDILSITRTWTFTSSDKLESE
jgi:protein TonB